MIKLIIFDLDGVLIDAKDIHFDALNKALKEIDEKYIISHQDHLSKFDGISSKEKLNKLSMERGLPFELHEKIWTHKQKITHDELKKLPINENIVNILAKIKALGIKVACCSNSIRNTIYTAISTIGAIEYFDLILSNEDVNNIKPHPEIYWNAMSSFNVLPQETLIVEDSPVGLFAAQRSGANLLQVKNSKDLTIEKITPRLYNNLNMNTSWQDKNLNILIPMAGAGSRFEQCGYTFPKPLIEVNKKPMIQTVVENLNFEAQHTFIVQKAHKDKYNLDSMLQLIRNGCNIVEIDGLTEGAACTTLLAKDYINNDKPLIIANCDQYIEWNTSEFMYKMQEQDVDAGILCFNSTHPKWSFAKIDECGFVTEVAEKNPISDIATVGVYYWKKGSDYVKYAEQMISNNIRHNNEFYVCPVFNQAIKDGKKIKTFMIEKMWGIGTPEDLRYFLENYNGFNIS